MSRVSVVVPTYRRIAELERALASLAAQSYRDLEIILVDDSGERSWNERVAGIAAGFQCRNPHIELIHIVNQPNRGSAEARNVGIQAAHGEYITFLDDDDLYLPLKVEKQAIFMLERQLDYCITDLDLYNENEKLIDRRVRSYIKTTEPDRLRNYHLKYHMTGTDTMMFRREYLQKIGGFPPVDVGDEFYLMERAIEGKGRFGYLPGCDVKAYVHTDAQGLSSGDGKIAGENSLYQYKKSFFPMLDRETKRYIRMRHYAVLAFAEVRRKRWLSFVGNAVLSFLCAPIACTNMILTMR